jgi:transposase
MAFAIEWMVYEGQWEEARAERREFGPGAIRDWFSQRRLTALYSGMQMRHDATEMFSRQAKRVEAEDLRRWQAAHGEPVDPPITEAEVFGWSTHPIALALEFLWGIWEHDFAGAPDGTVLHYHDPEGTGNLAFQKRGGIVVIGSGEEGAAVLRVPLAEFIEGVRDFTTGLIGEIRRRAPELLDWPEVAALLAVEDGSVAPN